MLTIEKIAEIEAGCEGVTPGDWWSHKGLVFLGGQGGFDLRGAPHAEPNAEHIARLNGPAVRELCRLARIGIEAQASHHKDNSHER